MKKTWRWIATACAAMLVCGLAWRALPSNDRATDHAAPASGMVRAATPRGSAGMAPMAAPNDAPGHASSEPIDDPRFQQCHRDYQRAVQARADELAKGTPRDRLAAAMWLQTSLGTADVAVRTLLESAVRDAPDDPLVAWLYAARCHTRNGCDESAAIERLLRTDPDNLAVWMHALGVAVRRGDTVQSEALLQRAARAPHIDLRLGETARLTYAALGPIPTTQACRDAADSIEVELGLGRPGTLDDLAMAGAVASAAALPVSFGISRLCPIRSPVLPDRLASCRAVFTRMARSDEMVPHLFGTRALAVHAATPAERAYWRERLRNSYWMQAQVGPLTRVEHLPLAWEQGEVALFIALLEDAGRWPAPPGWLPDDPEARALIAGNAQS